MSEVKTTKTALAKQLNVSRSSLYYKHKRPKSDEELRMAIEAVMLKNPGYGHRRVALALGINHKRAQRVMSLYQLKPARRSKTPVKIEDQGKEALKFSDITVILSPIAPNVVWVSDFTYICFKGQFIYLATFIDLFTKEVLGVSIMLRHTSEFVCQALKEAITKSKTTPTWCHSDQGSEYGSDLYLSILADHNIQPSFSPKSSPWRNGMQESFFGRFKVEFGDFNRYQSLAELIEAIYGFIHYYNNHRIHTKLKMSPLEFKNKYLNNQQTLTGYKQVISLPL